MIINDVNSIMRWKFSPLPVGYTQLEYIGANADGPRLTVAGVTVTKDTAFEIDYKLTDTSQSSTYNTVFGVAASVYGYPGYVLMVESNWVGFRIGSGTQFNYSAPANTNRHVIKYDGTNFFIDGVQQTRSTDDNLTVSINNYPLYIFARCSAGSVYGASKRMNLYHFKLWNRNTGVLLCDYFPAKRDSDSVVGVYDLVQDVFRTNQGTGTFTYG